MSRKINSKKAVCHPDRPHKAKGLCDSCYKIKGRTVPSKCHPDKPHAAKGLCQTCYSRHYEYTSKRKAYKKCLDSTAKRKLSKYNYNKSSKNREYQKQYDKTPKARKRKLDYNKSYVKSRKSKDVNFKLSLLLRSRLVVALKGNYRSGSAIRDLGCTLDEFRIYMESLFQPGMSWDNWSRTGWHIDHIIPLANFDLTDREQLLKACHYTNLQPLWASDNIRKGNKCHD